MLPNNVGEWKKLLADLPDAMLFDLDVKGNIGSINTAKVEVEERYCGYDGTLSKPKYSKQLVLTVEVDE